MIPKKHTKKTKKLTIGNHAKTFIYTRTFRDKQTVKTGANGTKHKYLPTRDDDSKDSGHIALWNSLGLNFFKI